MNVFKGVTSGLAVVAVAFGVLAGAGSTESQAAGYGAPNGTSNNSYYVRLDRFYGSFGHGSHRFARGGYTDSVDQRHGLRTSKGLRAKTRRY